VEKIADSPRVVKFLGGERCKPKPNIGVIQVVLQRASVGDDGNISKYPAAYLKIDLGIVPGSQQSTEISNWFQDEIIAMIMINKSLPEAKVDAKVLGVFYHKKLSIWYTQGMQWYKRYTQSSVLRNVNLRNHWWGGARKRINQKGSEPGNAITSGDSP
jgi:hypothetical protein